MGPVKYLTPESAGSFWHWENYVIAQAVTASTGQIPRHALALGLQVSKSRITLVLQVSNRDEEAELDLDDIAGDLSALINGEVEVCTKTLVRSAPQISPRDGVFWIYIVR